MQPADRPVVMPNTGPTNELPAVDGHFQVGTPVALHRHIGIRKRQRSSFSSPT